jgi:hypothetical protein
METLTLTTTSKNAIIDYREKNHLVKYEYGILDEIITAIDQEDLNKLEWFKQFGDAIRCITMNVYAHRKSLEFGFTEIEFDQYGWFKRPVFLDKEDIILGNPDRYGEHSIIHLGRGFNHIWTYALNYSFGTAGGGSALSVYDKQFQSREQALTAALNKLKDMMTEKIGNSDNCNYKQQIIIATLRDIVKMQVNMVQLSLF